MRRARVVAALALVGCAGPDDPCAGSAGACVVATVRATPAAQLDHLEFNLAYGATLATVTTTSDDGAARATPIVVGLELGLTAPTRVGLVVAGKHAGVVVGTAAATLEVGLDQRLDLTLTLQPPVACVAGGLYCGGDKLAGAPDTLYQCNVGGVPLARGVCDGGCVNQPTEDDACRGVGGTCTGGGRYCGGDKLDGDPGTLYTCQAGVGVTPTRCPARCVVRPGLDDVCE